MLVLHMVPARKFILHIITAHSSQTIDYPLTGFLLDCPYDNNRCCSDSSCCYAGNSCCADGSGGCCATASTCCGAFCCGNGIATCCVDKCCNTGSTCCRGSSGNSTCCNAGYTCCGGQCVSDAVGFCCSGTICSRTSHDTCGGSHNNECRSEIAEQEANVNLGFTWAMVSMSVLVFVVLCRSRQQFYGKSLFDNIVLLSNLSKFRLQSLISGFAHAISSFECTMK
jgi:hypothetical protein